MTLGASASEQAASEQAASEQASSKTAAGDEVETNAPLRGSDDQDEAPGRSLARESQDRAAQESDSESQDRAAQDAESQDPAAAGREALAPDASARGSKRPSRPPAETSRRTSSVPPPQHRRSRRLVRALRDGMGDDAALRSALGLVVEADDKDVARSMAQVVSATSIAGLTLADGTTKLHHRALSSAEVSVDSSLLGQLDEDGTGGIRLEAVQNVRTLLAVLRGGRLRQRRRALQTLSARLALGDLESDEKKAVTRTLQTLRDVELEYELARARERLGGAPGRKARAERDEWRREVEVLNRRVLAFWDAVETMEPFSALPGDRRAQLLLRTRDLPDLLIRHLCAVLEGEDGVSTRDSRRTLLIALRYAADPRLVPSLVVLLESGSGDLVGEAARALRRIEDPRARPALERAYERSVVDVIRIRVGAALGAHGDHRAAEYVRDLLRRKEDPEALRAGLAALDTLGGAEDTDSLLACLEHEDPDVTEAAVRALGCVGDGRALPALLLKQRTSMLSSLRAIVEDAEQAVRSRMELRGEEPDLPEEVEQAIAARSTLEPRSPPKTTTGKRWAAWRHYVLARLWIAFGALGRGLSRLEIAAGLRPGWVKPHVAQAMTHFRKRRHAQALAAFRQALEADRGFVERGPVTAVARTFLARADEVEREGRRDVAQGLLREAIGLDLRRAPLGLRLELERRLEVLRRRKKT